jgi:hypothetical protein
MDTLFSGILQLVVKTLIVFLLARSSDAPVKANVVTTLSKQTQVVRKAAAAVPPAVRRVPPPKKSVR